MSHLGSESFPTPPEREPDHAQEVFDSSGHRYAASKEWYANLDEPGFCEAIVAPGRRGILTHSEFEFVRIQRLHQLGELGMRPILEAAGIYTSVSPVNEQIGTMRAAVQIPHANQFVAAANALPRIEAPDRGSCAMRFEVFEGHSFDARRSVEAAARNTMLIADSARYSQHDIIDHAPAALALPHEMASSIKVKASQELWNLRDAQARNSSCVTTAGTEAMSLNIDNAITTAVMKHLLTEGQDTWAQMTWDDLFKMRNANERSHAIELTRQNIRDFAELIG